MNIAMEQTEEYVNGQLKAKYGDTFIRGNNGTAPLPIFSHAFTPHEQSAKLRPAFCLIWCCAVLYISTQKKRS
jgi:hypothetical protein